MQLSMNKGFRFFGIGIIILLFGFHSFSMRAQTLEDARQCFRDGEYEDAIVFFDAFLAMYENGGATADLLKEERAKAYRCSQLISQASSLIKRDNYTKAIEIFETILELNPFDPNVPRRIMECQRLRSEYLAMKEQEDAWKNCSSVSDYQAFIKKYPNSKYVTEAKSIMPVLEKKEDEQRWIDACKRNTIFAYESYLSGTRQSNHREEANNRLIPLYSERADELFEMGNYERAESDYIKVIAKGTMTSVQWARYHKAREENLFARINSPTTRKYIDMLSFVNDYPNSRYISLVRGHLVEYDMLHGYFNDARSQVTNYEVALNSSSTPNKKAWLRIIKEREKAYNRNKRKTNSLNRSQSSSITSSGDYPFMIGIPVKISSAFGASVSSGISLGGWCSPFNVDVLVGYNAKTEKTIFSIDPMFNIKRYEGDDPFSDYHICVGPTLLYSEPTGLVYGLRSGIGLHYSNLSLGLGYGADSGLIFDVALTFTLAHYHVRE